MVKSKSFDGRERSVRQSKGEMSFEALADRLAIREAVENWALWRDTGRWEKLRSLYTADGIMHTTWFVGSADEFIARCKEAARKGGRSQHFMGAASIEVNGERAIAETRLQLLVRGMLQSVEVDITCHARSYDRFAREGQAWRIKERILIYEKDRLDPLDPAATVKLDAAELARYPAGYRHLACLQASGGARITPGLPTPGSEALERLYRKGNQWLHSDKAQTP